MKKVKEYKVVSGPESASLEASIKTYLTAGWYPFGGVSRYGGSFSQVVVKYEVMEKKKICHNYTE